VIVSIHQPAYLPWLGYFDKIRQADRFIFLDTVQFQKQSFQNRNRIRTADGWTWLTVPVITKGRLYDTPLKDLEINNRVDWRRKHLVAIEMNYRKAPQFERIMAWLKAYYEQPWERLADLCFEMLLGFNRLLGIETPIVRASDLPPCAASKSNLILALCKTSGASHYLAGTLGRDYIDAAAFAHDGVAVSFQDYQHPRYRQIYPGFEANMAVIDLLMNEAEPGAIL